MNARVFVDTNVLVYARDRSEEDKHRLALGWLAALWEERAGRLSWQVLQEYYAAVTRKLDPPREASSARDDVAALITWRPIAVDLGIVDAAWSYEDRYGLPWWDALIVAAAKRGECTHLLTENFQNGQELDGVTVMNPFAHDPTELFR